MSEVKTTLAKLSADDMRDEAAEQASAKTGATGEQLDGFIICDAENQEEEKEQAG